MRALLKINLSLIFLTIFVATGCAGQWHRPTIVAYIEAEPDQYSKVIEALDQAVTRYQFLVSKAEQLDTVLGRKALVLAYRSRGGESTALDVSDIKRQGRMEFRLYSDYFSSDGEFKSFADLIVSVLNDFGAVQVEIGSEYLAR